MQLILCIEESNGDDNSKDGNKKNESVNGKI